MKEHCGHSHPLVITGSTQTTREPEHLHPHAVPYDERTVSDWLVFLSKYAKHINFFAEQDTDQASTTWERFFSADISLLLARIAEEEVFFLQEEVNGLVRSLQNDVLGESESRERFTLLFLHLFNLAFKLNEYYVNLDRSLEIRNAFGRQIKTHFEKRLKRLIAYYKSGSDEHNLFDPTTDQSPPNDYLSLATLATWNLDPIWFSQSAASTWEEYVASIVPDSSPYARNVLIPGSAADKINLAVRYQILNESVKGLLGGFLRIVHVARSSFDATISEWPSHTPDKALLLSFLKLLELYREEINSFTSRHLEHYYKEILELKTRDAQADRAFLVAELAKNRESALIEEGTEFKGGKDENGIERVYSAIETTVLNRAKVATLKSVLKDNGTICIAHNTATSDGIQEALELPENGFPAFGTNEMPLAQIGFGIASDHLYMKDGMRWIIITLECEQGQTIDLAAFLAMLQASTLRVSGKEGWIALKNLGISEADEANMVHVYGSISSDEPAVVDVDPALHARQCYPSLPVVELLIDQNHYEAWYGHKMHSIQLSVYVGGARHPELITSQGSVDASKPFPAFGTVPRKESSIVIGAHEALRKNVKDLSIGIQWAQRNAQAERISPTWETRPIAFEQLIGNSWIDISGPGIGNISEISATGIQRQALAVDQPYSSNSSAGFIRLRLTSDLEHLNFPNELAVASSQVARGVFPTSIANDTSLTEAEKIEASLPKPYQTPSVEGILLNYYASADIVKLVKTDELPAEGTTFYHLTPFGGYEATGKLTDLDNPTMFPVFDQAGELFIGIRDLDPGQAVQLLVRVVEGSANPLLAKQEVNWQLLNQNRWVDLENGVLHDGTNGLIQTGIVKLALPFHFKGSGKRFDGDEVWFRASLKQEPDSVCRLIDVRAQGLEVELISTGHSTTHYNSGLAAGTISRFRKNNPSVKKIEQVGSSVDGRAAEDSAGFYVRVSERLRHKSRTVSMWDYDRIVLEQFPQLSLVKTLSHTKYHIEEDTNKLQYSESAAGHVSIVCAPQKSDNFSSVQKPYTPVSTLESIRTFLNALKPEWVTLHVRNPLFEEIQLDFNVQFTNIVDDTNFYLELLHSELQDFLSPWKAESGSSLSFNRKVHKSQIVDFLDERPYVDYVRDVVMNVLYDSRDVEDQLDVEEATPRFAVSVLISSTNHKIDPL